MRRAVGLQNPCIFMRDLATRAKEHNAGEAVTVQGVDPDGVDSGVHDLFQMDHQARHRRSIADDLEDRVLHPLSVPFARSGNLTQATLPLARGRLDVIHHQEVHRTTRTCAS